MLSGNQFDVKTLVLDIPLPSSNNEFFLHGQSSIPSSGAKAIVIFAYRSGNSSISPRNQHVVKALDDFGLATLLINLLTPGEQGSDIKSQNKMQRKPPESLIMDSNR